MALSSFVGLLESALNGAWWRSFASSQRGREAAQALNRAFVGFQIGYTSTASGAVQSVTATVPFDDTPPTTSEGTQVLSVAYTPQKIGSKLKISVLLNVSASSAAVQVIAGLFKSGTTTAVASAADRPGDVTGLHNVDIHYEETTTSLAPSTWTVRAGPSSAATITINGVGGVRSFGGTLLSTITIEEIQQ